MRPPGRKRTCISSWPLGLYGWANEYERKLPEIEGALGATFEEGSWISTAYLVAEIIMIPLTAWLVQVSEIRLELNRAQIGLSDAYRRLAASTGSATPDFQAVATQSQSAPPLPASAQLLARLEQTTELRLAELQIVQSEASVGLEKAQRIPDLDVSIGSQYDASVRERVNLVGVSMPIPLFNRNQGNVLAASRRADQARDLRNASTTP